MNIADPALLVLGLLVAALLAWAAVAVARRRTAALAAAGVAAGSGRGRLAGAWFTIAGIAVLALAVAGPTVSIPVSHAKGTVILAVDVSGSMAATDVAPSRLAAAKQAAEAFINAQPGSVDIGVVAFEQGGIETAIPSADHATSAAAVQRLNTGGGTSLGSAIVAALSAITRKTITITPEGNAPGIGYWPSATIVLFSDGQDGGGASTSAGGAGRASGSGGGGASGGSDVDAGTAAAVAEQAGVHIDTVGVGTAAGTTVEADGYHLFTALDAATLKSISQATGGSYRPASNASELNGIASSIDLRLTVSREPLPLAGALIALALALLAAGAVLTVARTGRVV
ncbi:MAG TPA: VWA domain-containing protein [Trebonia sp.]|nr:VWA domain-containing protein [Trebonia sp.]